MRPLRCVAVYLAEQARNVRLLLRRTTSLAPAAQLLERRGPPRSYVIAGFYPLLALMELGAHRKRSVSNVHLVQRLLRRPCRNPRSHGFTANCGRPRRRWARQHGPCPHAPRLATGDISSRQQATEPACTLAIHVADSGCGGRIAFGTPVSAIRALDSASSLSNCCPSTPSSRHSASLARACTDHRIERRCRHDYRIGHADHGR